MKYNEEIQYEQGILSVPGGLHELIVNLTAIPVHGQCIFGVKATLAQQSMLIRLQFLNGNKMLCQMLPRKGSE